MASDIFWAKRASHIDDPETGLLARLPFSRDRLTAGVVAHLAVRDAICLGVLGRQVDARRLLTSIFGRVVELLEETEWIEELPAWDQYIRLQALSSSANIAHWLLDALHAECAGSPVRAPAARRGAVRTTRSCARAVPESGHAVGQESRPDSVSDHDRRDPCPCGVPRLSGLPYTPNDIYPLLR